MKFAVAALLVSTAYTLGPDPTKLTACTVKDTVKSCATAGEVCCSFDETKDPAGSAEKVAKATDVCIKDGKDAAKIKYASDKSGGGDAIDIEVTLKGCVAAGAAATKAGFAAAALAAAYYMA